MELPSDMMGYDRAITVFSPDGRLLQVEYARKTVNQGTTAIGMVCKDGIIFVADRRILEKLIVVDSIEKVAKIDDHIGATMSGLTGDGRVLIERARKIAQSHKVIYGEDIGVLDLVKQICDYKQVFTQYGGMRPFGVSLIIGGIDNGTPKLFVTEPSGVYFGYKAAAIGEGESTAIRILEEKYKENMTMEEGIKLGVEILKEILKDKFKLERLEIAKIPLKTKKFIKLNRKEIEKIVGSV